MAALYYYTGVIMAFITIAAALADIANLYIW